MNILIGGGKGNMALELEAGCKLQGVNFLNFGKGSGHDYMPDKTVAIHFGSNEYFLELVILCEKLKVPLIVGSTGIEIPPCPEIPIIKAPNLSLTMMRFMVAFPIFVKAIGAQKQLKIVESHQSGKADVSGTAKTIAQALEIPESEIESIRTEGLQLAFGVPKDNLDGHAYHQFLFTGEVGIDFIVKTKIHGRKVYAEGAIELAQAIVAQTVPLKNGIYELKDILHLIPL